MSDTKSPLAVEFGRLITEARKASGLSRRALARKIGISDVALLAYEDGRGNPTARQLEEVASWYGIDVAIVQKLSTDQTKAR